MKMRTSAASEPRDAPSLLAATVHKAERGNGPREHASGMERPVRGRVMERASRGAGVPGDPEKCRGDRRGEARRIITAAAVMIGGGSSVLACPMCFGAEETSMVDGTKLGVLVMVVVTLAVQGAFVGFFLYLRKRAKCIAEIELDTEWSELQNSPRTS
jgi:hypothetical protein